MIQDKLKAVVAAATASPPPVDLLRIVVWPSKETPGYTDTPLNWTVEEMKYLITHHSENPK